MRTRFRLALIALTLMVALSTSCRTTHGRAEGSPRDPEIARLAETATVAFDRGAVSQALRFYSRALQRARAADDAREIGTLAYNIAACFVALGDLEAALAMLAEAKGEYERIQRPTHELVLMEAEILRQRDDLESAEQLLDSLRWPKKTRPQDHELRLAAALARVRIALNRKDAEAVKARLAEARKWAKGVAAIDAEAKLRELEGEWFLLQGEFNEAAKTFEKTARLWQQAGRYRAMALSLERAGDAYQQAQRGHEAFECFYRAARSFFGQGDDHKALLVVQKAVNLGDRLTPSQVERISVLFDKIRERASPGVSGKDKAPTSPE